MSALSSHTDAALKLGDQAERIAEILVCFSVCRRSATILSSLLEEPVGRTSARGTSVKLHFLNTASHCQRQTSTGNQEGVCFCFFVQFNSHIPHFLINRNPDKFVLSLGT